MTSQTDGGTLATTTAGWRPDPVFVLCMGRSGSTLLRFLLDAHPDLACPPETNLPALCGQLAIVSSLMATGIPLSAERDVTPTGVPDAVAGRIRRTLDELIDSYLERRGKQLFCDKSLGTARFADLLSQIYPGARFLCLYRHPMDVIRSGLDACPFGLNGYGFEQYIAGSPGNAVLALARYWLDNATLITEVEEANPDRCHRVRYEDLVEDPEGVMLNVYAFIGVKPAPGVAQSCFSTDRERLGPADHKIWATSEVSRDSVGTGEQVPAALVLPAVTASINGLADTLGYLPIDENWGTPGRPSDPRVPSTIPNAVPLPRVSTQRQPLPGPLPELLQARMASVGEQFARRWDPYAAQKFLIVSRSVASRSESQWLVDIAARKVTGDDDADDAEWSILGSPQAWQSVLCGQVNLHAALRRCDLRYCTSGEDSPQATQTRVAMLADLLGLGSWSWAAFPRDMLVPAAAAAT